MTSYKRAIIVGATVTWCRKYFHSGTSSFHFRIFLCICLPNNNTETTLPSLQVILAFCSEWNSRFIPVSWKWTFFRIENLLTVWSGKCGACVSDLARERTPWNRLVDSIMCMQYKLHSGTKLGPEWKSFRYVNSPLKHVTCLGGVM